MFTISYLKKILVLLLLLYPCFLAAFSQAPIVSVIPDSLKKDAGMVKQMDETDIEIESPRKAKLHLKYVYTILNSSGDQFSTVYTFYDRFHKLKNLTAILYDGNGKELKKIRKNEMEDWSAEGSSTLLTDTRIKIFHFSQHTYPYTISYEEETDLDGYFFLPQWLPQPLASVSVIDCSLLVNIPSDYPLHYKEYHLPEEGAVIEKNGTKTYVWKIRNRKAAQAEPFSPAWIHLEPCVKLAPGEFEIQGFKGYLDSWVDFGIFMHELWKDRDILPEEAKKKVDNLVSGVADTRKKIDLLYDFLQKNSHYVSIQLGIGGWQPFDAAYVYRNRYGDCKALCNYMVALLKEAAIPANNVLIKAGSEDPEMDTSFVSSQFNHVIVLAFAGKDSIWLECTSQTINPGYLWSFTDDRNGLILNNEKSRIVHTPKYGIKDNQVDRKIKGILDNNGNITAEVKTRSTGLEEDWIRDLTKRYTKKELLELRQRNLGLSNGIIRDLKYQEMGGDIPAIEEIIHMDAENYASVSGNRIFIDPGAFLKKVLPVLENHKTRINDIELMSSFQETDTLEMQVPSGYITEKTIPNHHMTNAFGSFTFHMSLEGEHLLIVSRFQQNKGIYPAADFSQFSQLLNLVYRENNGEIVLVKK